jgi:hypothetical protein
MRARAIAGFFALGLITLAGCAAGPIRVYDSKTGAPESVAVAKPGDLDPRGEPAVCLFAWHGNHYLGELGVLRDAGNFRSLLLLTSDHLNPDGCGVLLSIRQGGSPHSIGGTSFVDVFSPYGGEQVLRAQADGGTHFGFRDVAWYLKTELQEGRPLRSKLDALKKSQPLIDEDAVSKLAEGEPLIWDGLIAATSSPYEKNQLIASKKAAESAAATPDDSDDKDEDDSMSETAPSPAEKPWWSKP